eukprot:10697670-Alexandrium_andersonii.AAC.1
MCITATCATRYVARKSKGAGSNTPDRKTVDNNNNTVSQCHNVAANASTCRSSCGLGTSSVMLPLMPNKTATLKYSPK